MTLTITTVGLFAAKEFLLICKDLDINRINLVNNGMLGNFKTLTYEIDIPANEMIEKRRKIMRAITETRVLAALYEHGDWMKAYIFSRSAFK